MVEIDTHACLSLLNRIEKENSQINNKKDMLLKAIDK